MELAALLAYTPDQYSAFWGAIAALATVAAAAVAIVTLLALKRDSADRTRPVMVADLRPEVLSNQISILVVSNVGQSVAKKVRVSFDPPLPELAGPAAAGKVTPFLKRRYVREIPTLAPGAQLFNVYSVGVSDDSGRTRNDEPTPDRFTIKFDYEDSHGKSYGDTYELDLSVLHDQTGSYPSNTDARGMQKRLVKALEAIARGVGRH